MIRDGGTIVSGERVVGAGRAMFFSSTREEVCVSIGTPGRSREHQDRTAGKTRRSAGGATVLGNLVYMKSQYIKHKPAQSCLSLTFNQYTWVDSRGNLCSSTLLHLFRNTYTHILGEGEGDRSQPVRVVDTESLTPDFSPQRKSPPRITRKGAPKKLVDKSEDLTIMTETRMVCMEPYPVNHTQYPSIHPTIYLSINLCMYLRGPCIAS